MNLMKFTGTRRSSLILLTAAILFLQWRPTDSSSSSLMKQFRTLSLMGDKIARTMKQSPMYYVKRFLNPSKRPSTYNSPIYSLPMKLISNGNPMGIFHGSTFGHKRPSSVAASSVSNLFHLPLNFLSNGKPTGLSLSSPGSFLQQAISNAQKYPNIIKLPLTFLSNARPIGINLNQPQLLQRPIHHHQQSSSIFNLPLAFVSNAKPFGISLKPFFL